MDLQSRQKQGPEFVSTQSKNIVLGMKKWNNMTAVIILVFSLIGFEYESL